jgi:adenylyltransferase/sulfurtransferase
MDRRYHRQIRLRDFGREGQEKLSMSSVLVLGAGGLGCPALQYLTAAGVGRIGIVDDDVVSVENLHRQILYKTSDVGKPKAVCAGSTLAALNPEIRIEIYEKRLTNLNALEILRLYDVIIDGTDNFASRYLVNDACVLLNKPLIYGSVSRYEGQLAVFNATNSSGPPANYRDLFPQPPGEGEVPDCEESGVLGVLPGIIGTMQANEAIKLLTGKGNILANQLYTYNSLTSGVYQVEIVPGEKKQSGIPATEEEFRKFDYGWFCGQVLPPGIEIDLSDFDDLYRNDGMAVLDIRKNAENPGFIEKLRYYHIPYAELKIAMHLLGEENEVVVICQSGISSRNAVKMLSDRFGSEKKFYSLRGGMTGLNEYLNRK